MTTDSLNITGFDASLAPREGDLLSLPFDQYGRMRVAQNLLHTLYTEITSAPEGQAAEGFKLSVLDVGGYPGVLRHFASPDFYDVSVVDVVPDDGSIPGYTQGSGMELPYPDGSFDVVTALDTLEHIPGNERDRFLSEMMRVARHAAVLINPVQSIQADLSEETLNEYIRWILDAQQEQLAEHREYGLPGVTLTEAAFQQAGWHTTTFPLANVYNWLLMMIAKHYLISLRDDRATAFERTLDRFYNLTFSDGDRAEPAYRGVIVAVRPGLAGALSRVIADYPPIATNDASNSVRLQLTEVLMTMLDLKTANHEDRLLREQMERRDKHIAGMEGRMTVQDIEIDRLKVQLAALQNEARLKDDHIGNLETTLGQVREDYHNEFQEHARYISRLEGELKNKDEHILYLERLLQGMEAGRVFRLTRSVSRFLGRS
jgi:uncharacterized coiled-coil protein SlyX